MQNQHQLQILADDPYLRPHESYYHRIRENVQSMLHTLNHNEGGLANFSKSYFKYGIHQEGDDIVYREWAPGAQEVYLYGDFNGWNNRQYPAIKNQYGMWQLRLKCKIPEFSKLKVNVKLSNGAYEDRIPAWINYAIQNQKKAFDGAYVQLGKYKFEHPNPTWTNDELKIYQCHIGMSGIEERVHSFNYFRENVIDRIADLGYNCIQIMAIAEHPYYGSFGYHVSNFFAVSSRFGTPQDFKRLVDYAHSKNIKVLIDLVHGHAATNTLQGINLWDGTDYQYFHSLPRGRHELWDSRIFDYSKYEVLRFLLSNIRFWMEEYRLDGYRFDGVTSMLYIHHGINYGFTGNYNEYFNQNLDLDSLAYLCMANMLIKQINPYSISISEDVSGFPALCRKYEEGGIGFDFRLTMAIPDMWIKLLKEKQDDEWNMEEIVHQLGNRRWKQKSITYAESHDQALVGDKTISMWLFDREIYFNMSMFQQESLTVFRGMALHKLIRLITLSMGGDGYLNFMGNEFGHPEWIDFPRQGNGWSYHHCRRRWDLVDDDLLRYKRLNNFDKDMLGLQIKSGFLKDPFAFVTVKNNGDKVVACERGGLLFIFNFSWQNSYQDYRIPVRENKGKLKVVLDTDQDRYGGHTRVNKDTVYQLQNFVHLGFPFSFKIYLPTRCAIVLQPSN